MSLAPEPVPADVLAAVRAPFEAYAAETGARWTDAPTLQPLGLLLDLAGEAMRPRLFAVAGPNGEELALRPEFTLPLVRAHIESGEGAARWLYEGQAFRVAPAGSGRSSEFLQVGVEALGGGDAVAEDARTLGLAWRAASAGGRDDLGVVFGDVSLFNAFTTAMGLAPAVRARLGRAFAGGRPMRAELSRLSAPPEPAPGADARGRLARLLAGLPEAEAVGVLEELWRLAGVQPVGGRDPAEIVHRLASRAQADAGPRLSPADAATLLEFLTLRDAPRVALARARALAGTTDGDFDVPLAAWEARLDAYAAAGVPTDRMTLACAFVRPFSYYDGVLFEVRSAALPEDAPVAAGGRYDGLVARLGGAPAPAVGCMVRPGRAWRDAPLPPPGARP